MKIICLILFVFLIQLFSYSQNVYIRGSAYKLPGKIFPVKFFDVLRDPIKQGFIPVKELYPDKFNKFSASIRVLAPQLYLISYGESAKSYIIYPNDTIDFVFRHAENTDTFKLNQFTKTIKAETVNVLCNNIARVTFFDSLESLLGTLDHTIIINSKDSKLSHDLFLKRLDFLNEYKEKYNLDSSFYKLAYTEIRGTYLNNLTVQGYFNSNFYDSTSFYSDLFSDDFSWVKVKKSRAYLGAILSFTKQYLRKSGWEQTSVEDNITERFNSIVQYLKDQETRNYFLTDFVVSIIKKQSKNFSEIFDLYKRTCTNIKYVIEVEKIYAEFLGKYNDIKIPYNTLANTFLFDYNNRKKIELQTLLLSNSPVLIDFWASWCGPCLMAMPSSKEFEEKYKTKINFIYVSVNKNQNAWEKAIREQNLTGNHFLLQNGFSTALAKILKLTSVPRYIIVNKGQVTVFDGASPINKPIFDQMLRNSLL